MANNDFLKRQKEREQKIFEAGIRIGIQQQWDYTQVMLRDPEIVGRDVFGRARLERLFHGLKKAVDNFHEAFTDGVEADVKQEELDRCLYEIWGDDLVPFRERYDELRSYSYNKARRGWK